MSAPNERSHLLENANGPNSSRNAVTNYLEETSSEEEEEDEDAIEIVSDPVDVLMARYGSSMGTTLGVSGGGVETLGTSFKRRGSMSFVVHEPERKLSMTADIRRRRSSARSSDLLTRTDSRKHRPTALTAQRRASKSSSTRVSDVWVEDVESGEVGHTDGPYLHGVSSSQFWGCFSAFLATWFVASFDSTLMASSHPVITSYFDASNAASWLSTSFLLTSTAFQPLFGRLSDTFGRRTLFLFALFNFGVGTALCAVSQTIVQFIMSRAVCGLGAGGAMALSTIVVGDLVPLHLRGSYMSILSVAYGMGTSLGASLGGFLADELGWRWEFGIQVPGLVACFIIAFMTIPAGLGPYLARENNTTLWETLRAFDLAGSALLTSCVTILVLALSLGGNIVPWSHPGISIAFIACAILGTILIRVEKRASKPLLPLNILFRVPQGNIIFSNSLTCMTMNTILFNVPLFFQATLLDTPTRSGTRLIVPFVIGATAAFATGNIITYTKRLRPTILIGTLMIVLGSVSLTLMGRDLPTGAYSWLIAITTVGQSLSFCTLSIAILAVTDPEDMAVAISTLFLFRNLGTILGVVLSSLVCQNALVYYLEHMVRGENREAVIIAVRQSVGAVAKLDSVYREQVINAYAAAMKLTFGQGIVTAAIGLLLIMWIKLPRLTAEPVTVSIGE